MSGNGTLDGGTGVAGCGDDPQKYGGRRVASVHARDWFRRLVGVDEEEFAAHRARYVRVLGFRRLPGSDGPVPEMALVTAAAPAGVHNAGSFYLASLGALRMRAPKDPARPPQRCVLNILQLVDGASARFVDVGSLQADPNNAGAMFQVASNFNCAEAASEAVSPDSRGFLEGYAFDRTQGPAASMSAGPGAVVRVHAPFCDGNPRHAREGWGQRADRQVNMLEGLAPYFRVVNGYEVTTPGRCEPLPRDAEVLGRLLAEAKVGVHLGIEVAYGGRCRAASRVGGRTASADELALRPGPPHAVDQVLCAALNLAQGALGAVNSADPDASRKGRFLLRAAYEGAYLAAVACGRRKLYLTMVGAGAFGNDPRVVFEEIRRAHVKVGCGLRNATLEEVNLALFSDYGVATQDFVHALTGSGDGRARRRAVPFRLYECAEGRKTLRLDFSAT